MRKDSGCSYTNKYINPTYQTTSPVVSWDGLANSNPQSKWGLLDQSMDRDFRMIYHVTNKLYRYTVQPLVVWKVSRFVGVYTLNDSNSVPEK